MSEHRNIRSDHSWLLDDVVNRVAGTLGAVLLSADGIQTGRSGGMTKDDADQLAAIASSLRSLANGVSRKFSRGQVVQNMIEMEKGFLFVMTAGRGTCLAVLADETVDVATIAYESSRLVKRVGEHLTAAERNAAQPVSPGAT